MTTPNKINSGFYRIATIDGTGSVTDLTVTGNISAGNLIGNITGNIANANYSAYAGDITTAAQPNITSVGTLTSLDVTGAVTGGSFAGDGSALSAITGSNVTGTVANANYSAYAGDITTAAQPNVTSVGTLTGLSVAGTTSTVDLTVTGNVVGDLLPDMTGATANGSGIFNDSVYSLGSSSQRWKTVYVSGNTIYLDNTALSVTSNGNLSVDGNILIAQSNTGVTDLGNVANLNITGGSNGQVLTTDGNGNLSWTTTSNGTGGNDSEITNTDGYNTYSVSVGTDGVVSMNTSRGGIEFGALPEIGGPQHLHIMRPAGQEGSTDLFFGDDYNYVKMPGLYGPNTQGVEIGSSYNSGTVSTWRFDTNGNLTFPDGTTQTTAYVTTNVVTSYKGFSAHYGRMYNSEPTLSKLAIYKDTVSPNSIIDTSTEDDLFQVTGLSGSDIVALFVIMGSDSNTPTDLLILRTFTETVIDNVLLNNGVEGNFNDIETMKTSFYNNYSTIAAQAGGLYSNFQFYNTVFQNTSGGTGTTLEGSGAVFEIGDNGLGAYNPSGIQNNGTNYLPGHKIKVLGTDLGGVTPDNDCIITVDTISGSGQIFQWSVSGVAAGTMSAVYGPVTGTNYQVGSGFVISGVRKESNGTIQNDGVNAWGTNYVVGDVITLPGTLFTGCTSPDNDLTMTVTSIGGVGEPYGFILTGNLPIGLWPNNSINDGGDDQYDTGNFISTDLGTNIIYNDGNVVSNATNEFGSGSNYVVVYQDSIFGILATGASINSIKTDGGSGFDGSGSADTGSLFGNDGGVDIGDFIFAGRTLTVSGSGEDLTIQAPDDLYLDAVEDDIFIRANDDIRLRTSYNFTDSSYQWEFRFNSDGTQTWYYNGSGDDYGYIRPIDDGFTRGLSVEGVGNTYIKSNWQNHTWTFDNTGNLTLPGNLIASSGASPAPYLSGFSSINAVDTISVGNVTLYANGVISGNGSQLTEVATQTTGSWTVTPGQATYTFTAPINATYSMWVRGNIPNGIIVWNATITLTNTDVPVIGSQYGWYNTAGNQLTLDSIPAQIIGTSGSVITSNPTLSAPTNVFNFIITNNTVSDVVIEWGYTKL